MVRIKQWIKSLTSKRQQVSYKDKLKYCFTAHNGEKYFTFPNDLGLSIPRLIQVQNLLDRLYSGINAENRKKMRDVMKQALHDGLNNPDNVAKIASMIHLSEIQEGDFIQRDILINIAATLLIREDEDPIDINSDLHKHKCDVFMKEVTLSTPHSFFFKTSLSELSILMKLSEEELQLLWDRNIARQTEILTILDSMTLVTE